MRRTVEDRLENGFGEYYDVEPNTGCWLWLRATGSGDRYGQVWSGGKMKSAHRLMYEVHHGPIPKGMLLMHKCDTPSCVNPAHLVLGTQFDNMQDCARKGRVHIANGERHGNSKFTEDQAQWILEHRDAYSQRELAKRFGVWQSAISKLLLGKSWKHIDRESDPYCGARIVIEESKG